jgi:hypothetical protein
VKSTRKAYRLEVGGLFKAELTRAFNRFSMVTALRLAAPTAAAGDPSVEDAGLELDVIDGLGIRIVLLDSVTALLVLALLGFIPKAAMTSCRSLLTLGPKAEGSPDLVFKLGGGIELEAAFPARPLPLLVAVLVTTADGCTSPADSRSRYAESNDTPGGRTEESELDGRNTIFRSLIVSSFATSACAVSRTRIS